MYYAAMRKYDIANGTGIRTTLFVSGCKHDCPGCFNGAYQNFKYGNKWDEDAKKLFMTYVQDKNVYGVTILGGEPMDQVQDDDLEDLLKSIKEETGKDIWLFSGYTYEEIMAHPKRSAILLWCDTLVDGLFVEALKDIKLKFKGSSNQRLIDVQASLARGEVVMRTLEE